jgi:hypothetical protein
VRFLPLADSAGDTHCELRAPPDIEKVNQRNGGQHLLPLRNLNTLELPVAAGSLGHIPADEPTQAGRLLSRG